MKSRTTQAFSFSSETMLRAQTLLERARVDVETANQLGLHQEKVEAPSASTLPALEPPVKIDGYGLLASDYTALQEITGQRSKTGEALLRVIMHPPTSVAIMRRVQQYIATAQRTNRQQARAIERRNATALKRHSTAARRTAGTVNMSRVVEALVLLGLKGLETQGNGTVKSTSRSRSNARKVA